MTANERAVPNYLLSGSRASYYTMKVFAYLRYKGLHFDLVKVTDQIAEDVIKPLTGGWRVVPVLYGSDSGYVQDSSLILGTTTNQASNTNCRRKSSTTTGKKYQVVALDLCIFRYVLGVIEFQRKNARRKLTVSA